MTAPGLVPDFGTGALRNYVNLNVSDKERPP
jgi:hypothetical protein